MRSQILRKSLFLNCSRFRNFHFLFQGCTVQKLKLIKFTKYLHKSFFKAMIVQIKIKEFDSLLGGNHSKHEKTLFLNIHKTLFKTMTIV